MALLREAAADDPDDLEALRSLSSALASTGALAESVEIGRAVLARDPQDAALCASLVDLLRRQGRDEEAAALAAAER